MPWRKQLFEQRNQTSFHFIQKETTWKVGIPFTQKMNKAYKTTICFECSKPGYGISTCQNSKIWVVNIEPKNLSGNLSGKLDW
jgi:hypothetical protein